MLPNTMIPKLRKGGAYQSATTVKFLQERMESHALFVVGHQKEALVSISYIHV